MNGQDNYEQLKHEYERIKEKHLLAIRRTAARLVPGSSVIRVFEKGTKKKLLPVLAKVEIETLKTLAGPEQFKLWFERELNRVARAIKRQNPKNKRIHPGYKWGHATKILTLLICELVLNSRYFSDDEVERISPWLYAPIDSIVMGRLKRLGVHLPFTRLREIDSAEKFYGVQELLRNPAADVGVPRAWFDDNWSERE
jgi:hypothetical protein